MSANWSLRSLGMPGVGMVQENLGAMNPAGLFNIGLVQMDATVRINALPPAYASIDECHPFFTTQFEFGVGWLNVMQVGVSPSGRICVTRIASSGGIYSSAPGLLIPDGAFHAISCFYDTGTGDLSVTMDGETAVTGSDAPGALVSPGNRQMRLLMFNGNGNISRTDISMNHAFVGTTDGTDTHTAEWLFGEKSGKTIYAVKGGSAADPFPGIDFTMTAVVDKVVAPYPVTNVAGEGLQWELGTTWTKRSQPKTAWTKVGIA